MKAGFLEKLIAKVNRVEPGEVQGYLMRLMKEKGFLEKVFDALQEGVIVTDGEGVVSYINRAACNLFALRRDKVMGHPLHQKIPGLDWKAIVHERKVVSRDMEVFYPENLYLNFYLAPILDEEVSNAVLGHVMIIRDITQSRQLEARKIESETLNVLTILAAGVAHEIGNPLNSLNIHLQLAQRKLRRAPAALREELTEILDVSKKEIERLDQIVSHFLSAIRPTKPQLELTDVNKLLEESIHFLEPEIEDRKIDMRLELHAGLPLLHLDPVQVKQAFYNLIRNANQALGTGGMLKLVTELEDNYVAVQFIDNGSGISAEDMANLAEAYYTTKLGGSGLGLLIVRRILREHGGEIEIESERGIGTKVTCRFPRTEKRLRLLDRKAQPPVEVIDV